MEIGTQCRLHHFLGENHWDQPLSEQPLYMQVIFVYDTTLLPASHLQISLSSRLSFG